MFNTRNDIFQIEQLALFNDETFDIQVADKAFFADDFDLPIQIETTNIARRSRRRNRMALLRSTENDNAQEVNIDEISEPEFNNNDVTESTNETRHLFQKII